MSGRCHECDELVGISPTPIAVSTDEDGNQVGTSRRWRIDVHKAEDTQTICKGSGGLV